MFKIFERNTCMLVSSFYVITYSLKVRVRVCDSHVKDQVYNCSKVNFLEFLLFRLAQRKTGKKLNAWRATFPSVDSYMLVC